MSIILQLDVGNSAIKWRLLGSDSSNARGAINHGDIADLPARLDIAAGVSAIWVSSVASEESNRALSAALECGFGITPWFAKSAERSGDLVNSYRDPSRMGVDRWLAMLGGRTHCPGALCVVDAGSALTIDLVAVDGRHEGGYIIPGPALMERALLLDTDRVRFDDDVGYSLSPGTSTAEAVRHGIALAQVGAVMTVADLDTRQLLITGGGGPELAGLLELESTLLPDLVFEGLAELARLEGLVGDS